LFAEDSLEVIYALLNRIGASFQSLDGDRQTKKVLFFVGREYSCHETPEERNGKKAHKNLMKEKAINYGEAIMTSSLKRKKFAMDYNSCYMASIGYGTSATSLSMDECKEIQKPPVNAILPKIGINRNTKREVVFGTTKYGGLGLVHLAAVQGYGQLQYLLVHLRSDDTSGTLYRILMEFTQLECGMEEEILSCEVRKEYLDTKLDHGMLEIPEAM
jgi:hypothetical protein